MEEKSNIKQVFEIDEKTLQATTKCPNSFECLGNENHVCLAKVESCVKEEVYFVDCEDIYCRYKMSFGYSSICNCPVRKEIFKKYNKKFLKKGRVFKEL